MTYISRISLDGSTQTQNRGPTLVAPGMQTLSGGMQLFAGRYDRLISTLAGAEELAVSTAVHQITKVYFYITKIMLMSRRI